MADPEFAAQLRAAMEVGRPRRDAREREQAEAEALEAERKAAREANKPALRARVLQAIHAALDYHKLGFLEKIKEGKNTAEMWFSTYLASQEEYETFEEAKASKGAGPYEELVQIADNVSVTVYLSAGGARDWTVMCYARMDW